MKKKTFLTKLNLKLDVIEEQARTKILKEIEKEIDDLIKKGKEEKEAVKAVGSINELTEKILKEHKISAKYYRKKGSNNSKRDNKFEDFIDFIVLRVENFVNKITKQDSQKIIEIVIYILLLILAFFLLKIPFWFVEAIGVGFLSLIGPPIGSGLIGLWVILLQITYFIVVVFSLIMFIKRITKDDLINEQTKPNKKKKEVIAESIDETTKTNSNSSNLLNVLTIIFKIGIFILALPLIFSLFGFIIGLVITLGILIGMMINGVFLMGPILIIIGFLIIIGSVISLIFYLIFKGGLK